MFQAHTVDRRETSPTSAWRRDCGGHLSVFRGNSPDDSSLLDYSSLGNERSDRRGARVGRCVPKDAPLLLLFGAEYTSGGPAVRSYHDRWRVGDGDGGRCCDTRVGCLAVRLVVKRYFWLEGVTKRKNVTERRCGPYVGV